MTHLQMSHLRSLADMPRLEFHERGGNTRASWKTYGQGVRNLDFWFTGGGISVTCSETQFAGYGDKRDSTKQTMHSLNRAQATILRDQLNKWLDA